MALNLTDASTGTWNSGKVSAFSSTTFTLATTGSLLDNVNANTNNYVAYLWSEVAGFSKFGSYTGNGSSDGPFVYCGFRPKFVLIKNISSASTNWRMMDSSRDTVNDGTGANWLLANSSAAEADERPIDFLSNGFKLRVSDGGDLNYSSNTMIFAAFAESPFKYSLAR